MWFSLQLSSQIEVSWSPTCIKGTSRHIQDSYSIFGDFFSFSLQFFHFVSEDGGKTSFFISDECHFDRGGLEG